jgi:molybdate transport system substrate-binding protein
MRNIVNATKAFMRCGIGCLIVVLLLGVANAYAESKTELIVSAAMSLKDGMTKLAADFEKAHPDCKISLNFAASGQLMAQIANGAPVDIFISAAAKDMDTLAAKDLIIGDTRFDLVSNRLVLIKNKQQTLALAKIDDLAKAEVKRIAIGNPESVPAGRYAQEALTFYKLYDTVQPKLVLGENVRQVLDYVARGEVEAGFVYATDAKTDKQVEVVLELPAETHKPIVYPAAVIKASKQIEIAKALLTFLRSKESRAILKEYGFN